MIDAIFYGLIIFILGVTIGCAVGTKLYQHALDGAGIKHED